MTDKALIGTDGANERLLRLWRTGRWWLAIALALVVLPYVPGLDSGFGRSLLSQIGIAAIFALSYNLLLGQTGLLSFGHAVFFGLGSYFAIHALRMINGGLPLPVFLLPLFGALGGLVFGLLFGAIMTRRGGTVFAMISLGVGELVGAASLMFTGFFGGEEGISADRTEAPHLFGLRFATQIEVYYLIAAWFLISLVAMYAFTRTPVGRMCNAVRDNAERAEFVGYNPRRVRFIAFVMAGTFAGVAGGLNAINYEIVTADSLSAIRSGGVLLMAFIGGMGHFFGAILGAALITWVQVSLSEYSAGWQLYLGLFFVVMVLFAPGGLAELIMRHKPLLQSRALPRVLASYLLALPPLLVMLFGTVMFLEMNYLMATKPELGNKLTVFWMDLDASQIGPWALSVGTAVIGFVGFRLTWPVIARAWNAAPRPKEDAP